MKQIVIRPYITEKTMQLAQTGWFSFVVAISANKAQITKEIEGIYKVHVIAVRTGIMHGKIKRAGRRQQMIEQSAWKKAMVQLKSGESIDAFQLGEKEAK